MLTWNAKRQRVNVIARCYKQLKKNLLIILIGQAATAFSFTVAASPLPPQTQSLGLGSFDAQLTGGWSSYSSKHGSAADVLTGIHYGLPGPADLHLLVPYRYDLKTDHRGLRSSLRTGITYQVLDNDSMYGTLQLYTSLGASDEAEGVGSGSASFGVRGDFINTAWWEGGNILLRGGWEEVDQRRPDSPPGPGSYQSVGLLTLEAGAEYELEGSPLRPYLGLRATSGIGTDPSKDQDSLSVRPGISIDLGGPHFVDVISQLDFMKRGAEPEMAVFVTFSFGNRVDGGDYENGLGQLERRVDDLARRVGNLEMRLLQDRESVATRSTITVVNQSGISELTALVNNEIREAGLTVTNSREDTDSPRRDRTVIRYQEQYREYAVQVARALPGNQLVESRQELAEGANIRIMIGFDLEGMLSH